MNGKTTCNYAGQFSSIWLRKIQCRLSDFETEIGLRLRLQNKKSCLLNKQLFRLH